MDKGYIEHEFYAAAQSLGIPVLSRMQAPVEVRPEGTLTAVSRQLYNRGEKTKDGSVAYSILAQLCKEFDMLKPKYLALHSVSPLHYKEIGERWVIRYAYIQ